MYLCALCECLVPLEVRIQCQIPWTWSSRWIVSHHVDARTETRSSGSIASTLKLWAIALALDLNSW